MNFVSLPYRISAGELTIVGRDTFLTEAAFHDASRKAVIGTDSDFIWLKRDQYVRTLAPVTADDRIALLVSLEAAGASAVRVCVRAIDQNGAAVACGFHTLACLTPSGDDAPLPIAMHERCSKHAEPTPSFATNAVAGGPSVASLFADDVLAHGARIASGSEAAAPSPEPARRPTVRSSVIFRASATIRPSVAGVVRRTAQFDAAEARPPRRSSMLGPIPEFAAPVIAEGGAGLAFVFPGSDGYNAQLLRELYAAMPESSSYIFEADAVARRYYKWSFFPLVDADSIAEHDAHLQRRPELAELGAFVSGVLFAEALHDRGIRPDVVLGHGWGELSALCVAGAFDVNTGLEIIAQRARALGTLPGSTQPATPGAAAQELERALGRFKFRSLRVQLYSPLAGGLLGPDTPLASFLASRALRESDFDAAVRTLRRAGCEYFVECGPGALTRRIGGILSGKPANGTAPAKQKTLSMRLADAASVLAQRATRPAAVTPSTDDRVVPAPPMAIGESAGPSPVAVTGIGCVLPGAGDLAAYWRNVVAGESAIGDHEPFDTEAWDPGGSVASATVSDVDHHPRIPFATDEFERLTSTQRMLAVALRECMPPLDGGGPASARRVRCILGGSAEGMREHEERALLDRVRQRIAVLDEPQSLRDAVSSGLDTLAGLADADPRALDASAALAAVVDRFVGSRTEVLLVDAACASSLYAVDLGIKSLRTMESDIVIVGGIFTPGASWHPLYALFEGLLGSAASPFGRRADGVVFGEGVALLALERLSDAVDGERIRAVIRGVGLSSDGRKASVSEPNAEGQALAIRRAYANAGVEPATIQLIEGHGVSDPASDASEVEALQAIFGDESGASSTRRPLQSVKASIGHTVWAAGAASIAKVCRALEERVVPPQPEIDADYTTPLVDSSAFEVPASSRAWPPNVDGEPRRAGVSAFGLGGTNAHAVIEAASKAYHRKLADDTSVELPRAPLAVVGISRMSPRDTTRHLTSGRSSLASRLRSEVVDELDVSQLLSVAGVEAVTSSLANWRIWRERTGVVAGMVGRTARGTDASDRIYRDMLRDVLTANSAELGLARADADRVANTLHERIGASTLPATPHTLMGLLPNIAAARVASLFDLHGPNAVIDAGSRSIIETLGAAERWLACGTADVMLACMLRSNVDGADALVLGLTTPAFARERGWTILGELAIGERGKDTMLVRPAEGTRTRVEVKIPTVRPLAGLDELAHALEGAAQRRATVMRWEQEPRGVVTPLSSRVVAARREVPNPG
ncbi:MAG: hypothetical protein JWL61_2022 [Gemmatimonadetes bacterium]|nr:hypothetical protein [Gemmatimonadota bacterium]